MTTIDWQEMVATSHLDTVVAVQKLLEQRQYDEAQEALYELQQAMANAERRALSSQLIRLMIHILKWRYQADKRSTSWVRTIVNARREIRDLRKYTPSFTREYIEELWAESFMDAIADAKTEMNLSRKDRFEPANLTWDEVFDDEYLL
jgi:citrate lyase synthetase